jgi:glycosyltransferase involved in cell wall biosynthesis
MMESQSNSLSLSILIPTYGRDHVLIDTISALLALPPPGPNEIVILDQSSHHSEECEAQLSRWHQSQKIRLMRLPTPSITIAMNLGLVVAKSTHVLFVDDDIIPDPELLSAHLSAARRFPKSLIAGRVLQPWHHGELDPENSPFCFNSLVERDHHEFIGCNFSLDRCTALEIGGFDRNFVKVAYRYEAEFAFRWLRAGHRIRYEPKALVHHLKIPSGGTRSHGEHLTTIRPDHSVGRYYFYWRTCSAPLALVYSLSSFLRSVYTRHHSRKPWWIPLTLLAELRGFLLSCKLALLGPKLQQSPPLKLLVIASHPIQYQVPIFRLLAADPSLDLEVLYLTVPDAVEQGEGFGVPFEWDIPMLTGYKWRKAKTLTGSGGFGTFSGLRLKRPVAEINSSSFGRPDVVLMTGWQCMGLLQLFIAARLKRISILLRMDNNEMRHRGLLMSVLHRLTLKQVKFVLPVGIANSKYYHSLGVVNTRMVASPHCVDNDRFIVLADQERPHRHQIRQNWKVPDSAFCFLFCGKLEEKKHPGDILAALAIIKQATTSTQVHCLFVGSGALESELKCQAERLNLPVTFIGFLNQRELPSAYVAADALVLPSDCNETWGLVVNEAMACGLPAIVSDQVGCAEDLIHNGQTGLVYSCRDVDALARAMLTFATNCAASQQMGKNAAHLVSSSYSLEAAARGIIKSSLLSFCSAP